MASVRASRDGKSVDGQGGLKTAFALMAGDFLRGAGPPHPAAEGAVEAPQGGDGAAASTSGDADGGGGGGYGYGYGYVERQRAAEVRPSALDALVTQIDAQLLGNGGASGSADVDVKADKRAVKIVTKQVLDAVLEFTVPSGCSELLVAASDVAPAIHAAHDLALVWEHANESDRPYIHHMVSSALGNEAPDVETNSLPSYVGMDAGLYRMVVQTIMTHSLPGAVVEEFSSSASGATGELMTSAAAVKLAKSTVKSSILTSTLEHINESMSGPNYDDNLRKKAHDMVTECAPRFDVPAVAGLCRALARAAAADPNVPQADTARARLTERLYRELCSVIEGAGSGSCDERAMPTFEVVLDLISERADEPRSLNLS